MLKLDLELLTAIGRQRQARPHFEASSSERDSLGSVARALPPPQHKHTASLFTPLPSGQIKRPTLAAIVIAHCAGRRRRANVEARALTGRPSARSGIDRV